MTETIPDKSVCANCGWHGSVKDAWMRDDGYGPIPVCPQCEIFALTLRVACDVDGCWNQVTDGWPSPNGYRHTCAEHRQ